MDIFCVSLPFLLQRSSVIPLAVFSNAEFVSSNVRDLCLSGAVEEAPLASLVVVSPLGVVPMKNGKLRLIFICGMLINS